MRACTLVCASLWLGVVVLWLRWSYGCGGHTVVVIIQLWWSYGYGDHTVVVVIWLWWSYGCGGHMVVVYSVTLGTKMCVWVTVNSQATKLIFEIGTYIVASIEAV